MTSLQTGMHYPIDLEALPIGWDKGYVGDFALEIQPGFASGKHNKEGRGIPHIRPYNIDRLGKLDLSEIKSVDPVANTKRLHSGDVLFNNTNSPELIGKTTVVTVAGDWGFSNHMTRVVLPDTVSPKFAAYQLHYLWSRGYFLHNCVKHVNQASVSSTTLARAVPFVKPPRGQQDCIVAEIEKQFSRLDEAVASLKRTKANLKRYKASVLKAAVDGKLTEDWRKQHLDVEPGSKFLERILAERRSKWTGKGKYKEPVGLDVIGLPSIPRGWTWASCDQLCSQITDGEHIQPRYKPAGYPMLSAKNVRDGYVDFGDIDFISEVDFKNCLKRCAPRENDVLIVSVGATTGRTAIVGHCEPFSIVRSVLLLRPLQKPRFMLRWLQSPWAQTLIRRASGSTAQAHLYIRDTRGIPIPLPSDPEQKEILAEVERRLSVIDELEATVEANLTRADRLRQSILNEAFSGRLMSQGTKTIPDTVTAFSLAAESPAKYGKDIRER